MGAAEVPVTKLCFAQGTQAIDELAVLSTEPVTPRHKFVVVLHLRGELSFQRQHALQELNVQIIHYASLCVVAPQSTRCLCSVAPSVLTLER